MKVETAVFHVYGDHGRAVVYFASQPGNKWTISVTIGRRTVDIENTDRRSEMRPCPTHALAIVKHLLDHPRLKVAK